MKTVELRVLCEGQTEQGFVTQVLRPHLEHFSVFPRAELFHRGRGGVVPFESLRAAIKQEVGRSKDHQFVTTMVDLYRLGKFPGVDRQQGDTTATRVARIEALMADRIPTPQFIPYIQVHEFEAFVFVDLDQLPAAFPDGEARHAVAELRRSAGTTAPEDINDGERSAPSKRLIQEVPAYKNLKSIVGPSIAFKIGLPKLRGACPHFDAWVSRLERLAERP